MGHFEDFVYVGLCLYVFVCASERELRLTSKIVELVRRIGTTYIVISLLCS